VTTLLLTWPLWIVRDELPPLPACWYLFPSFDVGYALLTSLVVVLIAPRAGVFLHTVLLVLSLGMDQVRIQPQVVCSCVLLWATLPSPSLQTFGRAYLVALWFYSGFHKLLSPEFYDGMWVMTRFLKDLAYATATPPQELVTILSVLAAVTEIVLAVMVLVPRTRKAACALAFVLHGSILIVLVQVQFNSAVWAWNVASGFSGFALLWNWRQTSVGAFQALSAPARVAVAVVFLSPLGYYGEFLDAYLSHCLYSRNTALGYIVPSEPPGPGVLFPCINEEVLKVTNSPLPPAHRLLEAYFVRSGKPSPGDFLYIRDRRLGAQLRGRSDRWLQLNDRGELVSSTQPYRLTPKPRE
jgi:uncharacterized membrane protein YphA (DoxX/SURF4 family)